ncbi:molybdopterin-synthase adenylyltransferase MoeB [Solilutibacter silvestris]|uniref:Molybdopterin-synthase adenylyltransferase n=1 Tax=Solilutibacter silvestris TaxID=1645665 RepID=A0A2K1PYL3_9GAMM|nr:molybdopterin-synthase adenylyltransferase MoeB [Lysobacter silvestris]PNS07885.1 ThiF family protein [Lysobacter silvestris]
MNVERIAPAEALRRVRGGVVLLDVRSDEERVLGMAAGAQGIVAADLLDTVAERFPDISTSLILICQRGQRSLATAEALQARGYRNIASIEGGTERWEAEDLPMQVTGEDPDFLDRYSRQIRLPQVGLEGQKKLQAATVVIIGAGGLGSPAAFYLAAAGIGRLRLIDDDVVDRSNLQRQILHANDRIGEAKVSSAQQALSALNPRTRIDAVNARIDATNVDALITDADVVLDGADNFPARHVLNDACLRLGKPLVYGAVQRFEGQVSVFDAGRQRGVAPCYRCLFPEAPDDAPNCAEAGVLGVLPGVIGMLQATEAIKLILGIGAPLVGRMLSFDALAMRFRETRIPVDPECPACGSAGR